MLVCYAQLPFLDSSDFDYRSVSREEEPPRKLDYGLAARTPATPHS